MLIQNPANGIDADHSSCLVLDVALHGGGSETLKLTGARRLEAAGSQGNAANRRLGSALHCNSPPRAPAATMDKGPDLPVRRPGASGESGPEERVQRMTPRVSSGKSRDWVRHLPGVAAAAGWVGISAFVLILLWSINPAAAEFPTRSDGFPSLAPLMQEVTPGVVNIATCP